jgi:hypothetical protein
MPENEEVVQEENTQVKKDIVLNIHNMKWDLRSILKSIKEEKKDG